MFFSGADIGSDHDLLMMTENKKISKPKHTRLNFDLEKLKDPNVLETFQAMIGGRFAPLTIMSNENTDIHSMITTVCMHRSPNFFVLSTSLSSDFKQKNIAHQHRHHQQQCFVAFCSTGFAFMNQQKCLAVLWRFAKVYEASSMNQQKCLALLWTFAIFGFCYE